MYIKPWTTKGEQESIKKRIDKRGTCSLNGVKKSTGVEGMGREGKQGRKGKAALVCFPAVPCCCTKTLIKWTKSNLGKGRVDLAQSILRATRAEM